MQDAPTARVFAPEAHRPREHRLIIDATGIVVEVGLGVRHALPWDRCQAVLRFPDRFELVLDETTSVVMRAADWFAGDQLLALVDRLAPADRLVRIAGEVEPDPTPYVLRGMATWSGGVLGVLALVCLFFAALFVLGSFGELDAGAQSKDLVIAAVFALPGLPLLAALRRRLAVPAQWREIAVQAGRGRVRVDHAVSRLPLPLLKGAAIAVPVAALGAVVLLWIRTGRIVGPLLWAGVGLGSYLGVEVRRRGLRVRPEKSLSGGGGPL